MKFIGYTSALCLALVGLENYAYSAPVARPVYMTSQIQRLLNEKQEKISKLEECDGKRKGFMIAGISTIGLTAVGVGVNIAQANKSNKLSNQIADQNRELEKQQSNLANINSQISEIQSNNARRECEFQEGKIYVNGQCIDKPANDNNNNGGGQGGNHDYSGYTLDCSHNTFDFYPGDNYTDVFNKLNNQCTTDTGKPMEMIFQEGGAQRYECKDYPSSSKCDATSSVEYDGIIGKPCNDAGVLWAAGGDKKCLQQEGATETVACSCPTVDNPNQLDPNQTDPNQTDPNQTDPNQTDPNQTVPNKPEPSRLEKCLADPARQGNDEALACCYLDKQVAEFKGGKCVCVDSTKKFVLGANKRGTCQGPNIDQNECFTKVKAYMQSNCQPCFAIWNLEGKDICRDEINTHGGYSKINKKAADDGISLFDIVAKNNHIGVFECPVMCNEDKVTESDCKASGGRGLDNAGKCLCDWTNNGNSQHLTRSKKTGLCECQQGYQRIDSNDFRLGCVSKTASEDLQAYKKLLEQLDKKYSDIDTAVDSVKRSMDLIISAKGMEDVEKYNYKSGLDTGMSTVRTRVRDANNLYNQAVEKYNGLSAEDKTRAGTDRTMKDKKALDALRKSIDRYQKDAEDYYKRGQEAYDNLTKLAANDTETTAKLEHACVTSHGSWLNGNCSCNSDKGLTDDIPNRTCKCGENNWGNRLDWCPGANKCVHKATYSGRC